MRKDWVTLTIKCALLAFLISLTVFFTYGTYVVYSLSNEIPKMIQAEVRESRDMLSLQITETRTALTKQVELARDSVLRVTDFHLAGMQDQLDKATFNLNARMDDLNRVLDHSLAEYNRTAQTALNTALEQTEVTLENTATASGNIAELTAKINQQEMMFYSRFLATTGELNRTLDANRRMAETLAKATPEITGNIVEITGNVAKVTDDVHEITKPKRQGFFRGILFPSLLSAVRIVF
jgi:methyl-accepting chemotaxis protein